MADMSKRLRDFREAMPANFSGHDHVFDPDILPIDSHLDEELAQEDFQGPSDVTWPTRSQEEIGLPGAPEPDGKGGCTDSLAFYLPYHFYESRWGIYVKPEGIQLVRAHLGAFFRSMNVPPIDQVKLCKTLLVQHELYHNKVEGVASRLELVNFLDRIYIDYFNSTYRKSFLDPDGPFEETCANTFAREALLKKKFYKDISFGGSAKAFRAELRGAINNFFSIQPRGYCEAALTKTNFAPLEGKLLSMYTASLPSPTPHISAIDHLWEGTRISESYIDAVELGRVFTYIPPTSRHSPGVQPAKYPNLKKKVFFKNLKKFNPSIEINPGGKHMQIVIPPNIRIPYTLKRDWVENYLMKEVCAALNVSARQLIAGH